MSYEPATRTKDRRRSTGRSLPVDGDVGPKARRRSGLSVVDKPRTRGGQAGTARSAEPNSNRDASEGTSDTPWDEFRVPQDRGVASQEGPCYREPGRIGRGTSQQLRVRRRHELRAPGEPERPRSQASLATRSAALPRGGATPPGLHHRGPPGASPDPPARPPALGPRKNTPPPLGGTRTTPSQGVACFSFSSASRRARSAASADGMTSGAGLVWILCTAVCASDRRVGSAPLSAMCVRGPSAS